MTYLHWFNEEEEVVEWRANPYDFQNFAKHASISRQCNKPQLFVFFFCLLYRNEISEFQ